jgi:hypothetical protein
MATKRKDDSKKQFYFHAALISEIAAKGFDSQRKAPPKDLSWESWLRAHKSNSISV